ncbi:MAG: 5'/3'-nucleotidase SurE [Desulfovibrionaceae bacterium]|nr:5'/3'-nucleotidase SurE [Desulfovibrionaceae bacterium]
MNILLTNDDGVRAVGIQALYRTLSRKHTVHMIAPMRQQSAVGQALTVFEPIRSQKYTFDHGCALALYGTPTDCVKLALGKLLTQKPDLVVSGINLGSNVGPDVLYSGTVAGATEGAINGLPAIAFSANDHGAQNLDIQAEHAANFIDQIDWQKLSGPRVINVNYPKDMTKCLGLKVCPPAKALWKNTYHERQDPRGNNYWWLDGEIDTSQIDKNSDYALLEAGYITVSSLLFDFEDLQGQQFLTNLNLK